MPYEITAPASKTLTVISRIEHTVADALETACGLLKSGYKDVAISDGEGHRIVGRDLEACCQGSKSLTSTLKAI